MREAAVGGGCEWVSRTTCGPFGSCPDPDFYVEEMGWPDAEDGVQNLGSARSLAKSDNGSSFLVIWCLEYTDDTYGQKNKHNRLLEAAPSDIHSAYHGSEQFQHGGVWTAAKTETIDAGASAVADARHRCLRDRTVFEAVVRFEHTPAYACTRLLRKENHGTSLVFLFFPGASILD